MLFYPVGAPAWHLIGKAREARLRRDPLYPRYTTYRAACANYEYAAAAARKAEAEAIADAQGREEAYWQRLSGWEFERHLAALFGQLGFMATVTKGSGDHGVDIWLETEGRRFAVQCKRHETPVGPALVREVIGVLHTEVAAGVVLACTAGFTRGAIDTARNQRVWLLGLREICALAQFAQRRSTDSPGLLRWLKGQ